MDNDLLKRVEVVKGASSVLHGSGAVGGIVSMRTKDVSDFINPGSDYGVTIGHRQESNHMNSIEPPSQLNLRKISAFYSTASTRISAR